MAKKYDPQKAISRASNPKMLAWYNDDQLGLTFERYGLTQDAEARTLSEVLSDERSKPADKIRVWRHVRDLRNDAAKARGAFVNVREERTRVDPNTGERIRQIIEARGVQAEDARATADDLGFSRQAPESREYVASYRAAHAHTEGDPTAASTQRVRDSDDDEGSGLDDSSPLGEPSTDAAERAAGEPGDQREPGHPLQDDQGDDV